MSGSIYAACASALSVAQSQKDDLAALLDPETGFAPTLRQICLDAIDDILEHNSQDDDTLREEVELLRLEANTWALLQALMPLRKTTPPSYPTPSALLSQNPYTPTSTLAHAIMYNSPLLQELIVVREWLHDTAPEPTQLEATNGYWVFTKNELRQAERTGRKQPGMVESLDPDAVCRREGVQLASDDATYDTKLQNALFSHVRAGRLDDALELCRKAKQPWRAAMLRGGLLFGWRALSTAPRPDASDSSDDAMDEEEEDADDDETVKLGSGGKDGWWGNRRRRVWKGACVRGVLDPTLPTQTRTLLASLVPTPQTLHTLREGGCRTWEDVVWAIVGVVVEGREGELLERAGSTPASTSGVNKSVGRSFWEDDEEGEDEGFWEDQGESGEGDAGQNEQKWEEEDDEEEWEKEVVSALTGLANVVVEEGSPATHPQHLSQLQIVLNRAPQLVEGFAGTLLNGNESAADAEHRHTTRFFAHLVLFLSLINGDSGTDSGKGLGVADAEAREIVLRGYLAVLEASNQRPLIALYAAALGHTAIERYASFLVSLRLSADPAERKVTLRRAGENGLDVGGVAVVACQGSINVALSELSVATGPLPSPVFVWTHQSFPEHDVMKPAGVLEAEWMLVRAMEWVTFDGIGYDESMGLDENRRDKLETAALEGSVIVCRYFLAMGKPALARLVLARLPQSVSQRRAPEDAANEFLGYRLFFGVLEALERVKECEGLLGEAGIEGSDRRGMTKETWGEWVGDYKTLIEQARDQMLKLLTTEWLVADNERGANDKRTRDLYRIRRLYIPDLLLKLHKLLVASRKQIPENLVHALALANTVADARYRLYDDFAPGAATDEGSVGRRLNDYLREVRLAVLAGLETGGSDWSRVVAGLA